MKARFLALLAAAVVCCAPAMRADSLVGGNTTVALNPSTVTALSNYFTIGLVPPATMSGLNVSFPITGDTYNGMNLATIEHSGGLSFTGKNTTTMPGVTTDIENFIINLMTDKISGTVVTPGGSLSGVNFFDIGMGNSLTLDSQLAQALVSAYGVPDLTGASIGTATINPAPTPEPSTLSMFGLALTGIATAARRRFARS